MGDNRGIIVGMDGRPVLAGRNSNTRGQLHAPCRAGRPEGAQVVDSLPSPSAKPETSAVLQPGDTHTRQDLDAPRRPPGPGGPHDAGSVHSSVTLDIAVRVGKSSPCMDDAPRAGMSTSLTPTPDRRPHLRTLVSFFSFGTLAKQTNKYSLNFFLFTWPTFHLSSILPSLPKLSQGFYP